MNPTIPRVVCHPHDPRAVLPCRMTTGSAGWDLMACLDAPLELPAGEWRAIPTGLILEIPPGFEGVVRPRSGLAFRHGIGVLNSPGTIDSDYRGEVRILLMNWGREPFRVEHGERVAQIVFQSVPSVEIAWGEVDPDTERGAGGFGHTGTGAAKEPS